MFVINEDNSIYATRGDIVFFTVTAEDNGEPYVFKAGDVVRVKIYGKKEADNVVLQKDFSVPIASESVTIFLTEEDTKLGEVISKPKDYWYEIELNPFTNPQTIIGYDEDGAKIFKLFPEGDDLNENTPPITPEDIPIIDEELNISSPRPIANKVVTREITSLNGRLKATQEDVNSKANALSEEIAVERARIDNVLALQDGSTTGDAELQDIRVGISGVIYDTAGNAVRNQIKQVTNAISKVVVENIYDTTVQTEETITEGAFIQSGKLISNENYFVTAPIDVSRFAGSYLYFNTLLHGYAADAAVVSCFDADDNFISNEGRNGNRYAVPLNASYIRLTVWKYAFWDIEDVNNAFMILTADVQVAPFPYGVKYLIPEKEQASVSRIAIDVRDNVVSFTAPSGEKYLNYTMQYFTGSNNRFFDFANISEADEFSAFPTNKTTAFVNGSDFFGPYIVRALKNIDGDKPDSLNFTGASHAYSGNTEGQTSATGRSELLAILVDGAKTSEYSGYCNTLDIYWVNYIQATNTKKADGTGREVLREEYHLHFDGETFEIENDITALEDIVIDRYYGLQIAQGVKGYSYSISYVGSSKNIVANNGNSKSADTNCKEIYIKRNDLPVECRFGLHHIGLGTFYSNNWYSAFDTEYGKSYFFMICPDKACNMVENQQVNFKGYYKFRYCG